VSGGPDSLALLVLAVEAGCRVTAVHVDHGLRPGSDREALVVQEAARRYGAAFRAERVVVRPGPNLEARARAARRSVLPPSSATGHTADDQAETVVLNLLRGAGSDGLSGMRPGPRHPLLALRRWETAALCEAEGLRPVRDPTNDDPSFLRNRVRHEVLPLLSGLAGRDLVPILARQARLLSEEVDLLEAMSEALDPTDAAVLARAPVALSRRAVRRWLRETSGPGGDATGGLPPPLAAVERVLSVARKEALACEVPGGARVRRSAGRLSIERPSTAAHEPGPGTGQSDGERAGCQPAERPRSVGPR
jgi:tRNA(Ile)-lysidine synthase